MPLSHEGAQVWDLALRLGGQLRVGAMAVIGWDMTAALAMAGALHMPLHLAAEMLPEIEAIFVAKTNHRIREGGRDD